MSHHRARPLLEGQSKPVLERHARLRHDTARNRWVVLAPERVFEPDAIAIAVLRLCDGSRTVDDIAAELALSYAADRTEILRDIMPMLQDLADKGVLSTGRSDA
jgi:pyrroloquinoline quinone biosynthesis protein D